MRGADVILYEKHDLRSVLPASTVTSASLAAQFLSLANDSDMFDLRAVLIMDGCNGMAR